MKMEIPVLLLGVHRSPLESYTNSTETPTQFVARQNNGKAGDEVAKVRRVISASPPHGLATKSATAVRQPKCQHAGQQIWQQDLESPEFCRL